MNSSSLQIMLRALRLPSVLANYEAVAATAASNNWGFEQYLHTVLEIETEDRGRRRTARLLKQSGLPDGKTLDTLDMAPLPQKVSAVNG